MAKVIKRKTAPKAVTINKTEAENSQLELFQIKQSMKQLETREKELKERLGEFMMKSLKPDGKGHFLFSTVDKDGNKVHLQRQARKKISLNQDRAKQFLIENKMDELIVTEPVVHPDATQDQVIEVLLAHAPHLIANHEFVDEKGLEQAVINEEIKMEQFEELCDINITYAMTFIKDSDVEKAQQDK